MTTEILPINFKVDGTSVYAGFWIRLAAFWVDFFVIIPIYLGIQFLAYKTSVGLYLSLVLTIIFSVCYFVVFVKRYGGTIGKIVVGLRIVKNNGKSIGWKEAILRESINILSSIVSGICFIIIVNQIGFEIYKSSDFSEQGNLFSKHKTWWYDTVDYFFYGWVLSEFIVLMLNKRRKAIHDYIASTLIVRNKFIKHISSHFS